MNTTLDYRALDDRRLIELHGAGDREAFRQIVERHQGMVCALALSGCGNVAHSEDVAQEVFLTAWKQLSELREPEKLRGWLAGIARNLTNNSFRRAQRTPTARAEPLSVETPVDGADPREHAIRADEAALMWSALEGIPVLYREPMVLFYREQRSMPAVAAALEISEEAVRQRLTRGRALLSERMASLVQETLERSAPTPAFSGLVIMALPSGPLMVETALGAGAAAKTASATGTVGGAAVKGGLFVKALALVGLLPALINGVTDFLRFRARQKSESSNEEQRRMAWNYFVLHGSTAVMLLLVVGLLARGQPIARVSSTLHAVLVILAVLVPLWCALRAKARLERPAGSTAPLWPRAVIRMSPATIFEYRSQSTLIGLPLVHVRIGGARQWRGPAVKAWVAIGDSVALGGLFASGSVAVAPLSFGGLTAGLLSLCGIGVGLFNVGWATVGWWTVGGFAAGWSAAKGGMVRAGEFAEGAMAAAPHANDAAAAAFFHDHAFFQLAGVTWHWALWAGWLAWLPPLLLAGWQLWRTRAR